MEDQNGKNIFRYGVGFSLSPNRSQPDPINYLTPKILAFNEFIKENPDFFNGLFLWHYPNRPKRHRSADFPVTAIPTSWIVWDNFIFIGQYFNKGIREVNDQDIDTILALFERLMPVYEFVESTFLAHRIKTNGERISRICWNDNGWIKPSGRSGKSDDSKSHEGEYGYGHEEWLCDVSRVLDGYHYSFLETIRGIEDSAAGKKYNIDLFTINGLTGKRNMVGRINNAEVIRSETAIEIKNEYQRRGWLDGMRKQIIDAGGSATGFSDWPGLNFFNIRFKLEDLQMFDEYLLIEDPRFEKQNRYELLYKKEEIQLAVPVSKSMIFKPDLSKEEDNGTSVETSVYNRQPRAIENKYLHKKMRDGLKNHLMDLHGHCVAKESPTGQGTLVDVAREWNGHLIFYEIKAYPTVRACLREAIGQLLEYSFWPDSERAKLLVVVGPMPLTDESRSYLLRLRNSFEIPLYYRQFDIESMTLTGGDMPDELALLPL
ncbi:hypothetical protein [[Flexibacter] sp. ATCC 35208]|uniref:hypothetical protein n=1 Tax=[Flexibacter] sp. ATCC 35208 TaxID=1936242 RepID=UPI00118003F1|nr:hypothetical protein [[Flexibacter] sp. ATCC 35208]